MASPGGLVFTLWCPWRVTPRARTMHRQLVLHLRIGVPKMFSVENINMHIYFLAHPSLGSAAYNQDCAFACLSAWATISAAFRKVR